MSKFATFTPADWHAYHEEQRRKGRIWTWAGTQVRNALREGVLIKASACEECGAADRVIEAAHIDYTAPLVVRWLCQPCHRKWDAAEPKTPVEDLVPRQRRTFHSAVA